MENLKKLFPISFLFTESVSKLVIGCIIYLLLGIAGGAVIALASLIPFVGIVCGILGLLVDLYVIGGIVLLFLDFFKVIK